MTPANLRVFVLHWSHFLFPLGYTALVVADYVIPEARPWYVWLLVCAPAVLVMTGAAFATMWHHSSRCQRCAELRPYLAPRFASIEDPHLMVRKLRRSHSMWLAGIGAEVGGMLCIASAFLDPDDPYLLIIVGEAVFAVGCWWVAYFQFRHISYYSHLCPWCKQKDQRRVARYEKRRSEAEQRG